MIKSQETSKNNWPSFWDPLSSWFSPQWRTWEFHD